MENEIFKRNLKKFVVILGQAFFALPFGYSSCNLSPAQRIELMWRLEHVADHFDYHIGLH
jgi:hypothetical protein